MTLLTFSWPCFDPDRHFPLLCKVRAVVVQQPEQSISSQTHVRLITSAQLLCITVTADCLERKNETTLMLQNICCIKKNTQVTTQLSKINWTLTELHVTWHLSETQLALVLLSKT